MVGLSAAVLVLAACGSGSSNSSDLASGKPSGQIVVFAARSLTGAFEKIGDRVRVRIDGKPSITAKVMPAAVDQLKLDDGGALWATVPPAAITVYSSTTNNEE